MLMERAKGITLPELLLVTTLLAILISFAIPSLSALSERLEYRRLSTTIYRNLSYARTEAIGRSKVVSLCGIKSEQDVCVMSGIQTLIIFEDDNRDGTFSVNERLLSSIDLPQRYFTINTNRKHIDFFEQGQTNKAGSYYLIKQSTSTRTAAITTSSVGRSYIRRLTD